MAIGASILRGEIRRHLLMNVGLVASCVVGATVVTNERGLFVPITVDMSDSARAFAAMFTQSHLLPDHEVTNVQMVTPLAPFEVTADSRDLRRRLMDALATSNDPTGAGGGTQDFSQNASQMPTLDNQVLSLGNSGGTSQTASGGAAGAAGGTGSGSGSGGATTVASGTGNGTGSTASGTGNNGQPITVANNNNAAQQQSASGVTDGSALGNTAGGTSLGNSGGTDQTGPTAVPEPSIWAMLIAGFGMIGYVLRSSSRKRRDSTEADATA